MRSVTLYNRMGPWWLIILVTKFGVGGLLAGAGVIGAYRGAAVGQWLPVEAMAMFVLGFGVFDLYRLNDRRPQITLSAEGMLDHRMSTPVLLPWSAISRILFNVVGPQSTATAEVSAIATDRFTGPGTSRALGGGAVNIQLDYLDITSDQFARLVREYAPHVALHGPGRREYSQGRSVKLFRLS